MAVSPVITRETTMWRAWVGFNATHSFGLILFGALYGYLAIRHSTSLFQSWFLLALGFALLLGYAVIAKLYFFTAPFRGVVLAAVLHLLRIVVNLAHSKFRLTQPDFNRDLSLYYVETTLKSDLARAVLVLPDKCFGLRTASESVSE